MIREESRFPYGLERGASGDAKPDYVYTGKEYDEETGLIYFGGRYYSPELGRWTTPDPLFLEKEPKKIIEMPLSANLYAYVKNNPMAFVDSSGETENYVFNENAVADRVGLNFQSTEYDRAVPSHVASKSFGGSQAGGGMGVKYKVMVGPYGVEVGTHSVSGVRYENGVLTPFTEDAASIEANTGFFKAEVKNINGEYKMDVKLVKDALSLDKLGVIELGGTIPIGTSGAAVNIELKFNTRECIQSFKDILDNKVPLPESFETSP